MKKIINLLCMLLFINLLILGNLLISKYNNNLHLLPISYAKTSTRSNDNYNLIIKILKDTNKNNLIKYAEYVDLNIVESIPNDSENKIAFVLSLPQKVSFIAIYEKISNDKYKYQCSVDNLASINNFYYYNDFLVVEQTDSNSSTDFNKREFFEIFSKKDGKYISVFTKNIYSEKLIKDTSTQDTNPNIFKDIEISSIDYLEGDIARVLCITTLTRYNGIYSPLTSSYEFTEIEKTTKKEIYQWNREKEIFSIVSNLEYK